MEERERGRMELFSWFWLEDEEMRLESNAVARVELSQPPLSLDIDEAAKDGATLLARNEEPILLYPSNLFIIITQKNLKKNQGIKR